MDQRRTESLLRCSRASCESAPTRGSLRILARGLTPSTSAVYCSSSRTRRSCLPDQGIGRSSRVCAQTQKRVATSYKTLGSLRSLSNPAASGSRRTGITRASRGSTGENRPNVSHVLRTQFGRSTGAVCAKGRDSESFPRWRRRGLPCAATAPACIAYWSMGRARPSWRQSTRSTTPTRRDPHESRQQRRSAAGLPFK